MSGFSSQPSASALTCPAHLDLFVFINSNITFLLLSYFQEQQLTTPKYLRLISFRRVRGIWKTPWALKNLLRQFPNLGKTLQARTFLWFCLISPFPFLLSRQNYHLLSECFTEGTGPSDVKENSEKKWLTKELQSRGLKRWLSLWSAYCASRGDWGSQYPQKFG